jgi:hypothetical protein
MKRFIILLDSRYPACAGTGFAGMTDRTEQTKRKDGREGRSPKYHPLNTRKAQKDGTLRERPLSSTANGEKMGTVLFFSIYLKLFLEK